MSNEWYRALKECEELDPDVVALSDEVYAILALTKELQTLNETLKLVVTDEYNDQVPLVTLLKRVFWTSDEGGWRHGS